jgi:hypothetical protein
MQGQHEAQLRYNRYEEIMELQQNNNNGFYSLIRKPFLLGLRFGLLFLGFCCCSVQLYKISCSSFTTLSMLHFVIGWFISCKVVNFAQFAKWKAANRPRDPDNPNYQDMKQCRKTLRSMQRQHEAQLRFNRYEEIMELQQYNNNGFYSLIFLAKLLILPLHCLYILVYRSYRSIVTKT